MNLFRQDISKDLFKLHNKGKSHRILLLWLSKILYHFSVFLYYRVLISGGPDGEIGASMRYLSQRFTMPNRMAAAVLNDIGTEELAHRGYQ